MDANIYLDFMSARHVCICQYLSLLCISVESVYLRDGQLNFYGREYAWAYEGGIYYVVGVHLIVGLLCFPRGRKFHIHMKHKSDFFIFLT